MKKVSAFLIGALLLSGIASAHPDKSKVTLKWGEEFKLPKKHYEIGFIGSPTEGFALISHKRGDELVIQRFDGGLKLKGESALSLKEMPKNYMIESIFDLNKKNYVFYSTYTKGENKERLFVQNIDLAKGSFTGSGKEIASSSDKLSGSLTMTGFYQYQMADKWNFVSSADSSKLLIHYTLKPEIKNDSKSHAKLGFVVFDKEMNKLWDKEIEMPYNEKVLDEVDYQVDRNGNVFILCKVYEDGRKESKDDRPNYHYEVFKIDKNSSKPTIAKFDLGERYVQDIAITEDLNGRMICAGYYSKNRRASTDGAFLFTFDESTMATKSLHKGFYEFPSELMKQFESAKVQKKMDKATDKGKDLEVANMEFKSLRVAADGSITMFGQQEYEVTVTYNNGRSSYTRTTYYSQDIYGMRINPDGSLKWVKKIPKNQLEANSDIGIGYFLRSDGDDNYLFFVDNIKNLNIGPDQAPAAHVGGAGGVLMCVKVAADGTVTKNSVYDFREEKTSLYVRNFTSVSPNQIIGRGMMKGKESRPILITAQ